MKNLFQNYGFEIEDTGGGCQWLRRPLGDGLSLVITDGEAGLPDSMAQLFVMTERHSDPVAQSELMTTDQMADHVAWALETEGNDLQGAESAHT
jgi:hypothetical protein